MPSSSFKLVKPLPTAAATSNLIRMKIKQNLTPLVKRHALYRQVLVGGWQPQHRPIFIGQVTIEGEMISAEIVVINSDQKINDYSSATVWDLWTWWEKTGTKAHIIRPVRAKVLRFQGDSGPVFTMIVNHPGTTPKRKTPALNKRLLVAVEPLLYKSVQEGIHGT